MTPEQYEKLPRYAKDKINELELKIHGLELALKVYSMKEPSPVMWGWDFQDQAWGYLAERETITFHMLDKPKRSIRVMLRDKNLLDINGDGTLEIIPNASNSIRIRHSEKP
jgi:hypothetical protein